MQTRLSPTARLRAGFTVSELLIAMTIGAIVSTLVMAFFVFNLRSIFHGEQKLLINGDIRDLTSTMMQQARAANFSVIYPSFYAQNSTTGLPVFRGRTFVDGSTTVTVPEYRVRAEEAGDFLVLVYTADNSIFDSRFYNADPTDDPIHQVQVTRIVGYWVAPNRTPGATGRNALYTFDTDTYRTPGTSTITTPWGATLPVSLTPTVTLESLLPPATAAEAVASRHPIVINDLVGRAVVDGVNTGLNFINFGNRSIIVQTRVLHGNRAKRVTNTYNFAITPRG
jgi:prepilin-type N-terminal cleavage/methylation domain-containing protein